MRGNRAQNYAGGISRKIKQAFVFGSSLLTLRASALSLLALLNSFSCCMPSMQIPPYAWIPFEHE